MPDVPTPLHNAMLSLVQTEGAMTPAAMVELVRARHPELLAGVPEPVVRGAVATGMHRLARRGRLVADGDRFGAAPARDAGVAAAFLVAA